ncbi:MAG: hypothetical protein IK076_01760, partial [Bacteroidales bacterium]|nr:hypothetical protein [Bacteroidales bacterium]
VAVAVMSAVISCILLQKWEEYTFFYREQNQLFLYDCPDIMSKLGGIGGFALVASQFIVQFFKLSWAGSVLTAWLGVCAALILWKTVIKKDAPQAAFPLCFLPVFFQDGALSDSLYYYQGFVAFVTIVVFLWLYVSLFQNKSKLIRVVAGVVISSLLYWLVGPAALPFAVCIIVLDALDGSEGWYLGAASLAVVLLFAWAAVRSGYIQSMRMALLQDFYYEPLVHPGLYIHASWIALPLVVAMAVLAGKLKGNVAQIAVACAAILLSLTALLRIPSHMDKKYYDMLRLNHFVVAGEWDSILSDRTARHENFLMMNVRNLALSHKGQLLDKLFDYPQSGFMSLVAADDQSDRIPDVIALDSHIYYQMGNVAHSQNKAFDASVGVRFGSPTMMMRLIRNNLAWGAYGVAGKYITEMEKTWGYRKEARDMRRFLWNDAAVEADPELGYLRRCIPPVDHFVGMDPHKDLELILSVEPDNTAARDYYVAYMLLAKDVEGLKAYIENDPKAYNPDGSLHVHLQEAVLVYSEEDEAYCREHGVTDGTFSRYQSFKRKFLELGASNGNPIRDMKSFSDTYWYYFMFKKI